MLPYAAKVYKVQVSPWSARKKAVDRESEILAEDVALPFHRRVPEEEATVHDAELRVEIHGLAARVNLGIERERDGGDHAIGRVPEVPDAAHLLGCK